MVEVALKVTQANGSERVFAFVVTVCLLCPRAPPSHRTRTRRCAPLPPTRPDGSWSTEPAASSQSRSGQAAVWTSLESRARSDPGSIPANNSLAGPSHRTRRTVLTRRRDSM